MLVIAAYVARAFNYEPPTSDMISALGELTRYVTVIEQPQDRAAPRKPAQARIFSRSARLTKKVVMTQGAMLFTPATASRWCLYLSA